MKTLTEQYKETTDRCLDALEDGGFDNKILILLIKSLVHENEELQCRLAECEKILDRNGLK